MNGSRPLALITGGAKRVGRQIALTLADAGYDIAITYHHSHGQAQELMELIRRTGAASLAIHADLTQPQTAADQIGHAITAQFSRLDVLVNNASIYQPDGLQNADPIQSHSMWDIHFLAPLLLCRTFEKQLRAAHGHVVNMVDLLVERPWPAYLAYSASKAALWNLTLSLARELAPEVNVNAIAPGVVDWPAGYPLADREKYLLRVPLARAGTPRDVADAVLFFCRDGAYVTGQILRLDGGRSLT